MKKVYLDFNATTPVDSELAAELPSLVQLWGNPSSVHWAGQAVKGKIREARQSIAKLLNVSPLEIVFTSGGSESNNAVLSHFFQQAQFLGNKQPGKKPPAEQMRNEFILSTVEHPSVTKAFQHFAEAGGIVHKVGFDKHGNFDFAGFEKLLSRKTLLVSMMYANNETGLILPLKKITEMAHAHGALVHSDAVQAVGKIPVDLKDLDVDFASFSGHKFYALKGAGVLYCKKGTEILPLIFGTQERHRRGGTENTLGISAMGYMAEKMNRDNYLSRQLERSIGLRNYFEKRLKEGISEISITHEFSPRLANTSSVVIRGVDGEALLMALDVKGFAVSTGSACSSGSSLPSASLIAFGLTQAEARSSLRVSFGWISTRDDVDQFIEALTEIVVRLRRLDVRERVIS